MPRAGVVNARRPGRRPGRSKAKSIDDAEHGASIEDAMVSDARTDSPNATFFRERWPRERTQFASGSRTALSRRTGTRSCARGQRVVRHVLSTHDRDKGHDQRWRERPRRGGLGPPAGQDTGVVHASVGSATATPAPVATAAQSAASRTRSRQVAPLERLVPSSRSWSHQG